MLGGGWVKNFGPACRHVPAVLDPHPELAGNVEPRLVGEAHAGRERRGFAVDQIDRLVHLHADAVAGAVRSAGQPVAGTVPPAFIGAADGVIDAARRARPTLAASIAICWPAWTWSHNLRCSGVGSAPNTKVRVMSAW